MIFLMIFMFFQCFSWFFIVLKSFYCDFCNGIIFVFQWFLFFHVIVFFGNGCLLVCFLTCARNKKVVVCCFCLFFFQICFSKYMWLWFSCGLTWYEMFECFLRCIEITIQYFNVFINCSWFFVFAVVTWLLWLMINGLTVINIFND
jgi:hypothetical protein